MYFNLSWNQGICINDADRICYKQILSTLKNTASDFVIFSRKLQSKGSQWIFSECCAKPMDDEWKLEFLYAVHKPIDFPGTFTPERLSYYLCCNLLKMGHAIDMSIVTASANVTENLQECNAIHSSHYITLFVLKVSTLYLVNNKSDSQRPLFMKKKVEMMPLTMLTFNVQLCTNYNNAKFSVFGKKMHATWGNKYTHASMQYFPSSSDHIIPSWTSQPVVKFFKQKNCHSSTLILYIIVN